MKKAALFILCLALLAGCKKATEEAQADLIILAMTNGQWVVTNFTQNGTTITADFSTYKFKYYSNKTVDALNNGTVEKTGTWDGNSTTMTTSASFLSPAYPLALINGTWHIDNSSWTSVTATQINGSETKTMRLDKQ